MTMAKKKDPVDPATAGTEEKSRSSSSLYFLYLPSDSVSVLPKGLRLFLDSCLLEERFGFQERISCRKRDYRKRKLLYTEPTGETLQQMMSFQTAE